MKMPLQYRKHTSRSNTWIVSDANRLYLASTIEESDAQAIVNAFAQRDELAAAMRIIAGEQPTGQITGPLHNYQIQNIARATLAKLETEAK